MKKLSKLLIAAACSAAFSTAQAAAVLVDTSVLPYWDGATVSADWGLGADGAGDNGSGFYNHATIGQTFTAGSSNERLWSFSFWLEALDGPITAVTAGIGSWNSSSDKFGGVIRQITGITTLPDVGDGLTKVTVNFGGDVILQAGQDYVAYFTILGEAPGSNAAAVGLATGDDYAGGDGFFFNTTDFPGRFASGALVAGKTWDTVNGDLAFKLEVPEPATTTLLLGSLGLLGLLGRRRKQQFAV